VTRPNSTQPVPPSSLSKRLEDRERVQRLEEAGEKLAVEARHRLHDVTDDDLDHAAWSGPQAEALNAWNEARKALRPETPPRDAISQLAECYRLSGADPDGDPDWMLAKDAVVEVKRMRAELDERESEDGSKGRVVVELSLEEATALVTIALGNSQEQHEARIRAHTESVAVPVVPASLLEEEQERVERAEDQKHAVLETIGPAEDKRRRLEARAEAAESHVERVRQELLERAGRAWSEAGRKRLEGRLEGSNHREGEAVAYEHAARLLLAPDQ
jgi:hypothetical protein